MQATSTSHRLLVNGAIAYLLIPNILFLFGWVQWWFAIPATLLLLAGWWGIDRQIPTVERCHKWDVQNILGVLFVLLLCFLVLESLGFTGRVEQSEDFRARNAILSTLVRCDWPLHSADGGYFVYYHAFYLPIAVICRLSCGLISAEVGIYLWSLLGMLLAGALLISRYGGKKAAVFLLLLCGMGFLSEWIEILIRAKEPLGISLLSEPTLLRGLYYLFKISYADFWRELAIDAPHCGIAVLLFFILTAQNNIQVRHLFFLSASVVLFSPYAAPGLLLFLLLRVIRGLLNNRQECIKLITGVTWCALPLLFAVACFLTSNPGRSFEPFKGFYTHSGELYYLGIGCYLLTVASLLVPAFVLLPKRYRRTSYFITLVILAIALPLPSFSDGNFSLKGTAVLSLCQAWLYAHLLLKRTYSHKKLLICFVAAACGYSVLHTAKQCTTFTLDREKQVHQNCKLSWHGHLNNPQDAAYNNFFSETGPNSPLLYSEEGASAHYLMRPFATGKKASEDKDAVPHP